MSLFDFIILAALLNTRDTRQIYLKFWDEEEARAKASAEGGAKVRRNK